MIELAHVLVRTWRLFEEAKSLTTCHRAAMNSKEFSCAGARVDCVRGRGSFWGDIDRDRRSRFLLYLFGNWAMGKLGKCESRDFC